MASKGHQDHDRDRRDPKKFGLRLRASYRKRNTDSNIMEMIGRRDDLTTINIATNGECLFKAIFFNKKSTVRGLKCCTLATWQRFASIARRLQIVAVVYIGSSWNAPLENIEHNIMGDHDRDV
jgi:hypothetical protein